MAQILHSQFSPLRSFPTNAAYDVYTRQENTTMSDNRILATALNYASQEWSDWNVYTLLANDCQTMVCQYTGLTRNQFIAEAINNELISIDYIL